MREKWRRFADEYLIDCNGTRAYKAAYPTVKSDAAAATNAGRLLKNAEVQAYIDQKMEDIRSQRTADATEVLEYLTAVLRGESRSTVCVTVGTGEGCSEAQLLEKPPDERERLKAAELLGRRYSLYTDKVDVSGSVPVIIAGEDALAE